jgi:hypothetical protein
MPKRESTRIGLLQWMLLLQLLLSGVVLWLVWR